MKKRGCAFNLFSIEHKILSFFNIIKIVTNIFKIDYANMMFKHTSMLKVEYIMTIICRSWKIHIYLYIGQYLKIKN
jgi:hypothetical protein